VIRCRRFQRSIDVAVPEEDRRDNNDFANERLREPQQSRDLILLRDDTEPARALDGITRVSLEIRKMRLSPCDAEIKREREREKERNTTSSNVRK